MTKQQLNQAWLIRQEISGITECAERFKKDIQYNAKHNKNVPTSGIEANLLALVDVWEQQQIDQLESQFAAL